MINCDKCQTWIALEEESTPPVIAAHLASCASCVAFRDAWDLIDATLAQQASNFRLPDDFVLQLAQRLEPQPARLSPEEISARREAWEQEYASESSRLDPWRQIRARSNSLFLLANMALLLVGAFLLTACLPALAQTWSWLTAQPAGLLVLATLFTALALIGAPWAAIRFPRWLPRVGRLPSEVFSLVLE
jgi:hypothetical protein